jgi:hypothetical protein
VAAKTKGATAAPTATDMLIAAVQEQTGWLRALAIPEVRASIERTLSKNTMRAAFEASDGTRTVREVAAASGASIGSISSWWSRWRAVGIAVERSGGRVAHLISLKELGLPIEVKED